MALAITPEKLANWKEHKLLRFLKAYYEAEEDNDKGIEGMASEAGVKRGVMIKALNGSTHLGGDSWGRLQKHFKVEIYREWLDARGRLR